MRDAWRGNGSEEIDDFAVAQSNFLCLFDSTTDEFEAR